MKRCVLTKGTYPVHCLVFLHYSSAIGVCQAYTICLFALQSKISYTFIDTFQLYLRTREASRPMNTSDHEGPDDDTKIEITDLDSTIHSRTLHELHFSSRARLWMI